ncbi:hypothetical protein HPB49_016876 [Dermacentor silvarum]|uniref:Uncharacterized protein n=1 Tax=Dermacentor silvarum TaxID=543639 RepID=A0ACB8E146_DERSI|nr:hypothetical protein HPB49_016876 [Dermacentor silvarum]
MDDPKVVFLHQLLDWLNTWRSKDLASGTLTKETHAALHQTTYALLEIASYCFNDRMGLSYALLGKLQTDSSEERFGQYRQLAGSQYHMSIRQLYEGENKLRLQSSLPVIPTSRGADGTWDDSWEDLRNQSKSSRSKWNVVVTADTLSKISDIIPVLVYAAGYAIHAALKR